MDADPGEPLRRELVVDATVRRRMAGAVIRANLVSRRGIGNSIGYLIVVVVAVVISITDPDLALFAALFVAAALLLIALRVLLLRGLVRARLPLGSLLAVEVGDDGIVIDRGQLSARYGWPLVRALARRGDLVQLSFRAGGRVLLPGELVDDRMLALAARKAAAAVSAAPAAAPPTERRRGSASG